MMCNRCGRPNPKGAANCQNCGLPLMSNASSGIGPDMDASNQHQPELPAWLETLRSSERPGAAAMGNRNVGPTGQANFSAADLVDEGMLPSWMRPERPASGDTGPSDAYPARRPASTPALNTDNTFTPTRGMSASSLIDEQALPSWMQEKPASPQQEGAQENIPAASLVHPEVLPEWMKTIQPPSPAPTPTRPVQYAQPTFPPEGIMGNDLIDRQSLPQWMSGQNTPASTGGQSGLPASSLLDENALPSWLRNAHQEQQGGNARAFPAAPQSAQPVQLTHSTEAAPPVQALPPMQPAQAMPASYNQAANMNSNLSGASFIDMSALPDWLKPAEEQRQQQGLPEVPRQASFGVPARPENTRVPSRPRTEMGPHEESEVAANVFASMLGVASAAPYVPAQQPGNVVGRSQEAGAMQPSPTQQPMPQQPWGNVNTHTNASGMPAGYGLQSGQSQQLNQGYGQAASGYQGGYAMGNGGMPFQPATPMNTAGMQPESALNNDNSQAKPKPARRGFLSTILDWFSR